MRAMRIAHRHHINLSTMGSRLPDYFCTFLFYSPPAMSGRDGIVARVNGPSWDELSMKRVLK